MNITLENSEMKLTGVHSEEDCVAPCAIHHMTNHNMRGMPQIWRPDTGVIERICEHNVGHPDPDSWTYLDSWQLIHGCDGCCNPGITRSWHDCPGALH